MVVTSTKLVLDSIEFAIDASQLENTKDGLLVKNAVLCKAMVYDYSGEKVLKPPEELKKMIQFSNRIVHTDEHPAERCVTSPDQIKGKIIPDSVTMVGDIVYGNFLITDKKLADKINNGKKDLSLGFYADTVKESGIYNDEKYEWTQRNIIPDHLASVRKGRCSTPICGILDSIQTSGGAMTEPITDDTKDKPILTDADAAETASKVPKEWLAYILDMMARLEAMMSNMPEPEKGKMLDMHKRIKKIMGDSANTVTDSAITATTSTSSNLGNTGTTSLSLDSTNATKKPVEEIMTEGKLTVDGVDYTPESVSKLLADSAALKIEMQTKASESKAAIDAKDAEITTLKTEATNLKSQLDTAEKMVREPYIKQITDAMPAMNADDLALFSTKRLADMAEATKGAAKLGGKPVTTDSKSMIDDAYAQTEKKGAE